MQNGWAAFTRFELVVVVAILAGMTLPAQAGTNGFIVPSFRGAANSQFGYWESFTVPIGAPGNLPDQPGATTTAVFTQFQPSAFIAGSGNLYNMNGTSSFTLTNATPFPFGTVILQTRTGGAEVDYNSVSMLYQDTNGTHVLSPLFRYELSRITVPGQGSSVSSLWQWDLTGLVTSNFTISFVASGASMSFDSMTLDTTAPIGTNFIDSVAFPQQPFRLQATKATVARWMYPFNGDPAGRPTASVFGALGDGPNFDTRDAQYLLGWVTTNRIPAGQGAKNYLIRRARVTLSIASGNQYVYTGGTLRDYRTYLPTNHPSYLATTNTASPVELFGAGFRGGFTNLENAFVPWAATNYPQDGPYYANPASPGFYSTNRVAYAAGFNTNGVLVDVSNSISDDGTNELVNPFEVAPFALGLTTNVAPGQLMPVRSQLTFDLNLNDPLIYGYMQSGLNDGNLSFIVSSLGAASFSGPPVYPNFYTSFAAVAATNFPLLDLEGEIVRSNLDSDADGLSDDWENFYFSSLANDATSDGDGDGANNLAEYQANTIPTAGTDWLHSLSLQHQPGTSELRFASAPGRRYSVLWSGDLQTWQTVTNPPLAYTSAWLAKTGTNLVYPSPVYAVWHDAGATNQQRFYRVGAH